MTTSMEPVPTVKMKTFRLELRQAVPHMVTGLLEECLLVVCGPRLTMRKYCILNRHFQ